MLTSCIAIAQPLQETYFSETTDYPDTTGWNVINVTTLGLDSTGIQPCILPWGSSTANTVYYFPAGVYLFTQPLVLPQRNIIIRGAGYTATTFRFDLASANLHCITTTSATVSPQFTLTSFPVRNDSVLHVSGKLRINPNADVVIRFNDSSLITSSWAYQNVTQHTRVKETTVRGDTTLLVLNTPIRYSIPEKSPSGNSTNPFIEIIDNTSNIGLECFTIERRDQTSGQTSNIFFNNIRNSWIRGVRSTKSNFSHVTLSAAINCTVEQCYFEDAFAFGSGGQGYGVVLQFGAQDNQVRNNIFRKLRHAILFQAGASWNIAAYNYVTEGFWTENILPQDAAGDIVLHGNYPVGNLIEGNEVGNIVIDNSHGINGPRNYVLRNKASNYGYVMNTDNATDSLFIYGNEMPNTGVIKGLFIVGGTGHSISGNWVKGSSSTLNTKVGFPDSKFLSSQPTWLSTLQKWPPFGYAVSSSAPILPAAKRFVSNTNLCPCNTRIHTSVSDWYNLQYNKTLISLETLCTVLVQANTRQATICSLFGECLSTENPIDFFSVCASGMYSIQLNNTTLYYIHIIR